MAASNTPQMKLVEFNTQTQLPIKLLVGQQYQYVRFFLGGDALPVIYQP
jgi:hypothetical protein